MITRVKGSYVVSYNGADHEIIRDGEVVYENDTITYVGKHYEGEVSKTGGAGNAVIMPGLIDLSALGDTDHDILHTKAFSNIRSGLNPSEEHFEKGTHGVMTVEEEAFKSLYAYTQLIMHGITTVMPITSTYYKKWADTYEEEEAGVHHAGKLGLRPYTSPGYQCGLSVVRLDGTMTVRYLEGQGEEGLGRAVRFVRKYDGAHDGLIHGALLPERTETQAKKDLIRTKQYAEELKCPIKLHAAQGLFEYHFIKEQIDRSLVEYLESIGFLGKNVGIPHCYIVKGTRWVEDGGDDLSILSNIGTTAIFRPVIIGRSGHYQDSFAKYRTRDINVAVGTGTFSPDFFQNIRIVFWFSQTAENKVEGSAMADVYRVVTLGSPALLGREDLGRLAPGAKADMIVVDLKDFHMGAVDDPIRTIFICGCGHNVKLPIINGKTVMKDRTIGGMDLEEIKAKGQKYYDKVRMGYMERDYRHLSEDELFRPSFPIYK